MKIVLASEVQIKMRRTLKGRQALWIVYDNYKVDAQPPGRELLEAMFIEELRKAPILLGFDIGVYDRAPVGSPERSYEYLHRCVQRNLEQRKFTANRREIGEAGKPGGCPCGPVFFRGRFGTV